MGFVHCRCGNIVHDNGECSGLLGDELVCQRCLFQNVPMNDQAFVTLTAKIIEPLKEVKLHEIVGMTKRQLKALEDNLEGSGLVSHGKPTPAGRMIWRSLSSVYCRRSYVVDMLNEMGIEVHV